MWDGGLIKVIQWSIQADDEGEEEIGDESYEEEGENNNTNNNNIWIEYDIEEENIV